MVTEISVRAENRDDDESGIEAVELTPASKKFILHWGEMGQAWGINRTMAQVHALLFISPEALDAEEISHLLDVSRSNVSTSLRELIAWGVIRRTHQIGGRRDKFEALKDVMETFRVIMAERKRREMDPTLVLLENCIRDAKSGGPTEEYTRAQLEKMLEFLNMLGLWYAQIDQLPSPALKGMFLNGHRIVSLFNLLLNNSARAKSFRAAAKDGNPGGEGGGGAAESEAGAGAGADLPDDLDLDLDDLDVSQLADSDVELPAKP